MPEFAPVTSAGWPVSTTGQASCGSCAAVGPAVGGGDGIALEGAADAPGTGTLEVEDSVMTAAIAYALA